MNISRVNPRFDYEWLSGYCQVFQITSSDGRFSYNDELFDRLAQNAHIASVAFCEGEAVWVLLWRKDVGASATSVVRELVRSRKDLRFNEPALRSVDPRTLLRLCLAAIADDQGLRGASNICGRLVVCLQGDHVEYFKGTGDPRVIHALEVGVSPRMELTLSVRTFTSCAVRSFKRSLPRFELVDGLFLRRRLGRYDPDARNHFCERVERKGERYGGFALLDASDEKSFAQSKLGVLHMVEACMGELFENAVSIEFEEARDVETKRRSAELKAKRIARVAERLEGREVRVVDATGVLGAEAERVVEVVSSFGLPVAVTDALDVATLNIRLVLEDERYGKDERDPHDDDLRGMAVQHMTPASLGKSDRAFATVVAVAVKELAIKLDVLEGRMCLIDWDFGSWSFGVRRGEKLAFVSVSEDGELGFSGPMPVMNAFDAYPDLADALVVDKGCECAVQGPDCDVCTIGKTDLFGMPDYELIAQDITTPPERRKLGRGGKPAKNAIGRSRTDIERYFADAVDIASCTGADGTRYYRVGMRGPGMDYSATHKASILRSVVPVGDSRDLTEELLPMLDCDLVRWGQPTVLPFPVKYLREWLAMNERDGEDDE